MRLPGKGTRWKELLLELKDEIAADRISDLAATVTFYGILALFPFLLFLVALAGVVIDAHQAERLVEQLGEVAPGAATQILADRLRQLGARQDVSLLGVGALGAIWAASGGTTALMRALNRCYDVEEGRPFWKVRGIAIVMTIVAGALSLVAALVAVATAPLAESIGGPAGTAMGWLRLPVAGVIMMFLWALLYYALPDAGRDFKLITPGSVVGVILWAIASWGFSRYVTSFGSYDRTYGSLGGVIVLLLWMWISSLVLLVGAEINTLVGHRSPERKQRGAREATGAALAAPPAAPARSRGRRPPVRGLLAIAAGLAAGFLLARREA